MASAAELVNLVYDRAWEEAQEKTALYDEKIQDVLDLIGNAPQITAPDALADIDVPPPPTITPLDPATAAALYDSTTQEIQALVTNGFADFLTTYYPVGTYLEEAQAWISRALTTGGSGVNTTVEAQLWERDRSRVMRDTARLEDEVMTSWAGRRYPLPPGALAYQLALVRREGQDKIAESSRNQAIKVFDTEVENARLAVGQALQLRLSAIQAAGDYIRTLVLGPQTGAQVATSLIDAQAKFAQSSVAYYSAQVESLEIALKVGQTNAELQARTNEANLRSQIEILGQRVNAAIEAARMVAAQAAAQLNALNASASISGSDVTNFEGN